MKEIVTKVVAKFLYNQFHYFHLNLLKSFSLY